MGSGVVGSLRDMHEGPCPAEMVSKWDGVADFWEPFKQDKAGVVVGRLEEGPSLSWPGRDDTGPRSRGLRTES